MLYAHNHNNTIIKTQEDFFRKIFVPRTLFVRVRKGCVGFYCERELETEQKLQYFNLHSYSRQRCVFLVLLMFNRRPRGPLCWVMAFFTTSFSATSLDPQLNRGPRAPSAWRGFPYHISSITPSPDLTGTNLTSVFTELYNSLTSTQSPTRSLKSHVLSLSSENNSHNRSLSSGASIYECAMGIFFTSSHFISQFPPTRLPVITAIRMCHFLPVHHLGMAFLAGSKVKIQHLVYTI